MDFLSYRGLPLQILQSTVHERAPQHDKSHSTFECTRWLVSFLVTYNPGAISYPAVGGGLPIPGSGQMPVITDKTIRAFLEKPRGQLIVRSATAPNTPYANLVNPAVNPASVVIVSPEGNRVCDVRNGPFCKVNSVQEVPGERLWKIHLTFETYINTPAAITGLPTIPFILNNRWSVTQDINWQHMSTRIYQGICTVNAALLNDPNFNPNIAGCRNRVLDSIRQSFAGFSVPLGFQRTFVKVEMTPDGNNAVYVVRDDQRHYNQPNQPDVPRIEVQDSNFCRHGSWGRGALQALNLSPYWWDYNFGANVQRLTAGISQAFATNLPRFNRNVIVRVWGNIKTQRPTLVSIALAIGAARMGQASVLSTTTSELVITGDSNRNITMNWSRSRLTSCVTLRWAVRAIRLIVSLEPVL